MRSHERRVVVPAPPEEVFAFLASAPNVPLFAPGVEEATLLSGAEGLQGARLGLRTRAGRELPAQVTHFHANEAWTVVDARGTVSQMQVEPGDAGTVVTATLAGSWRPDQERRLVAEWDAKLRDLERHFR